jgi:multiphosphoryl transfer protein
MELAMKETELVIQNPTGLHARPAKVLVNLAKQFQAEVRLLYGEKRVNAKSMVSVLTLGAGCGSRITVQVSGVDEDLALAEIVTAFQSGLGEGELQPPARLQADRKTDKANLTDLSDASLPCAEKSPAATSIIDDKDVILGIAAAPGIAIGPVFHYGQPMVVEPALTSDSAVTGDGKALLSLSDAQDSARAQLSALAQQMKDRKLSAEAEIFEAHIELMDDPELAEAVRARVASGDTQQQAWKNAVEERAALIAALPDTLLAARADDLRDVGQRVLRLMLGRNEKDTLPLPNHPVIVIARELSPSDTAGFDPAQVLGFCIVTGGPTSHIAILARAMGLPAIVGADEAILGLPAQTSVILNGNDGRLSANPSSEQLEQARQAQRRWSEQREMAQARSVLPAITQDGRHLAVTANAGSVRDAQEAVKNGADGIGLLRTEFLFLERSTAPSEDEQYQVYAAIARTMGERPVIIRTLDIGGDKPLPYIQLKPEMNPFLGERGIRLCMNRPELFNAQLRAVLRASPAGTLRIMFPMVSDISELRQARRLVDKLRGELDTPPVQLGIMVEVPSAAIMADIFAPEVDFFSIGTNDLTQYTLAVDRANSGLAARHDGLHPAVLRLIAQTIDAAHRNGKRADLCGELGSDPIAIPILVGLGMDELSVSIPAVPTVKALVRGLSLAKIQPLARLALQCSTAQEVRELVKKHMEG